MLPALDLRPLQEGHATRGIGRYVTTLVGALPFASVVVWEELPPPFGADGKHVVRVPGGPRHGRFGWGVDALRRRPHVERVHLPVVDVRLCSPMPDVVTAFDAIPWRFSDQYPSGRVGAIRRAGDARAARRAAVLITCSEASAEDLVAYCGVSPRRVRVVPLAAGPPWPEPAPGSGRLAPEASRSGRRYVVCAGGFQHHDPRKRLEDLVAALPGLPDDVSLVVTGAAGPGSHNLLGVAREVGVLDRVELTGHVAPEELVELYAGAAAFAFPSAWEGFGLPLVEAMSVGLPCVVTSGGALPEVAGDAATVVPVGQPESLAEALEEVLSDSGRAAEASRRSTVRAAAFSVRRFAAAHGKVYDEA